MMKVFRIMRWIRLLAAVGFRNVFVHICCLRVAVIEFSAGESGSRGNFNEDRIVAVRGRPQTIP